MSFSEHTTLSALTTLIDTIDQSPDQLWGITTIKRDYLRPITNEAFSLAMRNEIRDAEDIHVFYIEPTRIDIVWKGKQKSVFRQITSLVESSLLHAGMSNGSSAVVYYDPRAKKEAFLAGLNNGKAAVKETNNSIKGIDFPDEADDTSETSADDDGFELIANATQTELYQECALQKPYRTQLNILVVEDQIFSQRLLCEILRGARGRNGKDNAIIDAVQGVQDAWKLFVKKAPDVVFVDLCLPDGSGHMLASAIKSMDPTAHVIIVTANNYQEELSVARQNNVDGFIVKPYNKKQIMDCVERYVGVPKASSLSRVR